MTTSVPAFLQRLISRLPAWPGTSAGPAHNLPPQPLSRFRAGELAEIERLLTDMRVRRVWLTGAPGQGKSWLARLAGHRLQARFGKVCLVEFADFQGHDPLETVAATLSLLFASSRLGLEARLKKIPTLLILDDVGSLPEAVRARLLAATESWAECGDSRVLLTADSLAAPPQASDALLELADFSPAQAAEYLRERGLSTDLPALPGTPLSLNLLAHALRFAPDQRTDWRAIAAEDRLRVSLDLALAGLAPKNRSWLPRLSVFKGGALEDLLLRAGGYGQAVRANPTVSRGRYLLEAIDSGDPVTIAKAMNLAVPVGSVLPEDAARQILDIAGQHSARLRAELAQAEQKLAEEAGEPDWPELKKMLCETGLIQPRQVADYPAPYLQFHPSLSPLLAARLEDAPRWQERLSRVYYEWARGLNEDPAHAPALARCELPNLLYAVGAALDAGAENAVSFASYLGHLLEQLGLVQEQRQLDQRTDACRRRVRETQIALFGTHYQLKRHAQLIVAVVATIGKPENRPNLESGLARMEKNGWDKLVTAIRRILDGERDLPALCEPLDSEDSVTVKAILEGIKNPLVLTNYVAELQNTPPPALALTPQQARLVVAIVAGLLQPQLQPQLEFVLKNMERKGWHTLVAVVRGIQQGERGQDIGNELEDEGQRLMVKCILDGLANPESLRVLT